MSHRISVVLLSVLMTTLQALLWWGLNRPVQVPDVPVVKQTAQTQADARHAATPQDMAQTPIQGFALSAYTRWQGPPSDRIDAQELDHDLQTLRRYTHRLRTYSTDELPDLPSLAQRHGFDVSLGVWVSADHQRNARELAAAVDAANKHSNIRSLIVGNETRLQNRIPLQELIALLQTARTQTQVPLTTAEPWHVWLDHPELAQHVDIITVHLLPYWEGIPAQQAVDVVIERYRQVQARFPGKPVVIGETGWPSDGPARGAAVASPVAQAQFVRNFIRRAATLDIPYFLMEAIDQPWKISIEGQAGAYWGMLDAHRQAKFPLSGPVQRSTEWQLQASIACGLGLLASMVLLGKLPQLRRSARFVIAITTQILAAGAAILLTQAQVNYLTPAALVIWIVMLIPSALMVLILLTQLLEFADLYWEGHLRQALKPKPVDTDDAQSAASLPLISIHIACSNEPPEMVIGTLRSVLALDWPRLEVIMIDNNTHDAALWQPVRDFVAGLANNVEMAGETSGAVTGIDADGGPDSIVRKSASNQAGDLAYADSVDISIPGRHIRFRHIEQLEGYKAGALNVALSLTDRDAQWVAVVDSDYVVKSEWLRMIGGYFGDASIAIIQSPQAHQLNDDSRLARLMNAEYDSFFRIGMHHRHERNAIIQHGTMTVICADTLRTLNGWDEHCICEDTELGLRILQTGARAVYIDHVTGQGLLPATSESYCRQRLRWATGAMQIARKHAAVLWGWRPQRATAPDTTDKPRLTPAQRYHFVAGWLPWIGDTLHLVLTLGALGWSLGMLLDAQHVRAPAPLFMVPPLLLLGFRLTLSPLLYRRRVSGKNADWLGAALAGMGLSHTIARGILRGLLRRDSPFEVTRKSQPARTQSAQSTRTLQTICEHARAVREEGFLLTGLLGCALALSTQMPADAADVPALRAWLLMLVLQSLPYGAAVVMTGLSVRRITSAGSSDSEIPRG